VITQVPGIKYQEVGNLKYGKQRHEQEPILWQFDNLDIVKKNSLGGAGENQQRQGIRQIRISRLQQEIGELEAKLDYKFQQIGGVIVLCEEMLKYANYVLKVNQKTISQFLIDPTNRQKTYQ
jgi:hypothetical protein